MNNKKSVLRILFEIGKWSLLILILYTIGTELYHSLLQVEWTKIIIQPALIIFGSVLICLAMIAGSFATKYLYLRFSHQLSFFQAAILFTVPPLGKYIPTKAMTIVGSIAIAKSFKIRIAASISANLILMGIGLSCTTFIGMFLLLFQIPQMEFYKIVQAGAVLIGIGILTFILQPSIFGYLINQGLRFFRQEPLTLTLKTSQLLHLFIIILFQTGFNFSGYALISLGCINLPLGTFPIITGVTSIAYTVGFLAFFAPAGIGVREGVFLAALTPLIGLSSAGLIAIILRITQTFSDIIFGLSGIFAYLYLKKKHAPIPVTHTDINSAR